MPRSVASAGMRPLGLIFRYSGERYTICDAYLFTLAQWLEQDGVEPARVPKVMDHRRRVGERAATKKAIAQELA